jgi:Tol biopolymer transport system component
MARPRERCLYPAEFGFAYDLPDLAWSPDGRTIAFGGCTGCSYKSGIGATLWTEQADGTGLANVDSTGLGNVDRTSQDYSPTWAPDGGLYFGHGLALAEVQRDGSDDHVLFGDRGTFWLGAIAPSPDGTRIALRSNPDTLITINADGSNPVTQNGRAGMDLKWTADGRIITTTSAGLVEFSPDGGQLVVLVPGAAGFDLGGSR